jgi:formylglycine-generating enzyme required for sulfatase activity
VSFDVSWENSWRNSVNHDAVWVFVKYSTDSGASWEHATLVSAGKNPTGAWAGGRSNTEIIVPDDRMGAFIQRETAGAGKMIVPGVQLTWEWVADGLVAEDQAEVRVVGIEMVYIPGGSFFAGDGDGALASEYAFKAQGAATIPVEITGGSSQVSCLVSPNDDIDTSPVEVSGSLGLSGNALYPTGYKAFYVMKYEITEGQWVDFFNMIPPEAKVNRDITDAGGKNSDSVVNRNTVSVSSGMASTQRESRSCGYLSWMDLSAYAAWAALRPMTELEFEKAARGAGVIPVKGAYAWGDTKLTEATTISGFEGGSEVITNEGANVCHGNVNFSGGDGGSGPLRAGIFATGTSTRSQAGAGYYGVMELSGNLWERVVTLGTPQGRMFSGTHGTGDLSAEEGYEGNALNTDWPGYVEGEGVTGSNGSGFRGGSWMEISVSTLSLSDRSRAATSSSARLPDSGGRCARTDPGY